MSYLDRLIKFARTIIRVHRESKTYLSQVFQRVNLPFLDEDDYLLWRRKFKRYLNDLRFPEHKREIVSYFTTAKVQQLKSAGAIPDDTRRPICIAMVKNDPERIQLFFQHYRRLGIGRFAIIDNCSTDGTQEWLLHQPDADVYLMEDEFNGNRKNAFISRVMQLYGHNRWYLVVDTDELLSYSGMDHHDITDVVSWAERNGYQALRGYMVDMYSAQSSINEFVEYTHIEEQFNLFDTDSYEQWGIPIEGTVWGGPRQRMWNLQAILMKMPLFYFSEKTAYVTCHYLYPTLPLRKSPYVFALRHYKFLGLQDKKNYTERVACGNFYNGSAYYQPYMKLMEEEKQEKFVYSGTQTWHDESSIAKLPFITQMNL